MDDLQAMGRLLDALRPWYGHLVIVGGWAHQLHRHHPLASPPAHAVIRTGDADVALSLTAAIEGDIAAALEAADFEEELSSHHTPPVSQYRLDAADSGFYAEFLVPLRGSGQKRSGELDATALKAGVTAQKLRHLDLLLHAPWTMALDGKSGPPVTNPAQILVANPVSFVVQKLLIHKLRQPKKRAQDALYIHDTVELFSVSFPQLRALWEGSIKPTLSQSALDEIYRLQAEQFEVVTDAIRESARIPMDRALAPENVRAACAYGLNEILGE